MLTLFILKSGSNGADPERLRGSFGGVISKVIEVNALEDVDPTEVKTSWYGVFYDNEYADEGLEVSLKKNALQMERV